MVSVASYFIEKETNQLNVTTRRRRRSGGGDRKEEEEEEKCGCGFRKPIKSPE